MKCLQYSINFIPAPLPGLFITEGNEYLPLSAPQLPDSSTGQGRQDKETRSSCNNAGLGRHAEHLAYRLRREGW